MATYYVDSASGNDANSGLSGSPWKSLGKVTSVTLVAGDSVLFNRGGTWYPWDSGAGKTGGTFTIGESGSSGSPITYGTYGSGANPLISGFYTVPTTGWTQVGSSNVWTLTDTTHFPTTMINTLLYNGALTVLTRYPRTSYATYTGFTGNTQISFASGSLPSTYVGGDVVVRKNHWILTRGKITAETSTTITYTSPGDPAKLTGPTANYGFFVQNHQNCLSQAGDWCYDPTSQTLSMWFTSSPTGTILVSVTDSLVAFGASKNYNTFTGIDFTGGNNYGINGNYGGTGNQVVSCNFSYMGQHGIYFGGANSDVVSGNTVTDSANNAIYLTDAVNNKVLSNTVDRCGQAAGMGISSDDSVNGYGSYTSVVVGYATTGSGNIVKGNTVKNSGYIGMRILGDTFIADSNYVDTFCNVIDDGGGIYTQVGSTHAYSIRTITNNIVLNGIGAPAGTDGTSQANGIYCDDASSSVSIAGNTVYNCSQHGVFFHNCHEILFANNLLYNNTVAQLTISYDALTASVNFTISKNIMLANTATQLCFWFRSLTNNFASVGVCDNNSYGSLFTNTNLFSTQLSGFSSITRDLASWQSYTSLDANSTSDFHLTLTPAMTL